EEAVIARVAARVDVDVVGVEPRVPEVEHHGRAAAAARAGQRRPHGHAGDGDVVVDDVHAGVLQRGAHALVGADALLHVHDLAVHVGDVDAGRVVHGVDAPLVERL